MSIEDKLADLILDHQERHQDQATETIDSLLTSDRRARIIYGIRNLTSSRTTGQQNGM